jgi:hypothetical protein
MSRSARVTGAQEYWTVLTDPAGREYCLVARDPALTRAAAPPGCLAGVIGRGGGRHRRSAQEWGGQATFAGTV